MDIHGASSALAAAESDSVESTLDDGTRLLFRPIRPDDKDR